MELRNTIEDMLSNDYKKRFKAEYNQLKIRHEKLHRMVIQYEAGTLPFPATCPLSALRSQEMAMESYLYALEIRAEIEKIDLHEKPDIDHAMDAAFYAAMSSNDVVRKAR